MSAHDLMVLIAKPFNKSGNCSAVEAFKISEAADAILAAGYRKPKTVTTVEELDSLPADVIVMDSHGVSYKKDGAGPNWWLGFGDEYPLPVDCIDLPATVLYTPEVQA